MTTISRLAQKFGLSRSTLLYYDRIGLLCPSGRNESGYRLYSPADGERLEVICAYRRAGVTLEEIRAILASAEQPQREVLERRLKELGREIRTLQKQQQVLAGMLKARASGAPFSETDKELWVAMFRVAGMDEVDMMRWHREFEQRAPDDHHAFLLALGIPEQEAIQIRRDSGRMEKDELPSTTEQAKGKSMFIVSLNYVKPLEDVELHLEAHVEFLRKHYEKKVFIASGRKVPRTGGVILAQAESKAALDEILSADPFRKNAVAEYEITEFIPSMTLPEFASLIPG